MNLKLSHIMPVLTLLGGVIVVRVFPEYLFLALGSYLILVISLMMMHKAVRVFKLRHVTIPAVWYLTYLPMIFFPAFIVFAEKPDPWRNTFLIGVESVLITVPLGILIANYIFRFHTKEIENYFTATIQEKKIDVHLFFIFLLLSSVATILAFLYFYQLDTVPLFYMLRHPGDVDTLTMLREESFKLLDPRWQSSSSTYLFYAYLFLRTLLFPFLIITTLGYYLYTRKKGWLILFLGTFTLGGLYAASSLARAPLAAIFMRIFFFVYLFKSTKLNKKIIMMFLALTLSFPLLVTSLSHSRGSELGVVDTFKSIGIRLTITPAEDLYYYFEIFPDNHPYLYGQTLTKPILKVMGREYFYIENYVYHYISPLSPFETGHSNAAFISNFHADFGFPGVIIGGVVTGVLMQMLQIYLLRQNKTVLNMAVFSFLIYAIWVLNFGSLTSVLFVNGLIPILLFPPLIKATASFLRRSTEQ